MSTKTYIHELVCELDSLPTDADGASEKTLTEYRYTECLAKGVHSPIASLVECVKNPLEMQGRLLVLSSLVTWA